MRCIPTLPVRHSGGEAGILAPLVPSRAEARALPVDQIAIFPASQELLVELATTRVVVVVLEDMHWSDQPSRDLMHHWPVP